MAEALQMGILIASAVAALVAFALAAVVLRADARRSLNRRLACVLLADSALMTTLATMSVKPFEPVFEALLVAAILTAVALAYVLFMATQDTPVTRRLRQPSVLRLVVAAILLLFVVDATLMLSRLPAGFATTVDEVDDVDPELPWLLVGVTSLLALVVTISAYRRAEPATPTRRRAGFFALAFGARDVFFATGILGWGLLEAIGRPDLLDLSPIMIALGSILFALLLAYGILQTQLFDIDLKIKRGISRSTVAAIGIAVVLVAAKVVESYVSRELGFAAGGVAAGMVLFLAPRLNKLGDKVANTALPHVQPTSTYVSFKKMEVYRAAVEAALEDDGIIDAKERVMLDRLRGKLALTDADCQAVEAEVAPSSPTSAAAPSS